MWSIWSGVSGQSGFRLRAGYLVAPAMLVAMPVGAAHAAPVQRAPDQRAVALIDTAIARMGGPDVLRGLHRVRFEQMVQWLGLQFEGPQRGFASYNWNSRLNDYTLKSSRNTRRTTFGFRTTGTWDEFVDVVQDTVAMRRQSNGRSWVPLHVAYVDERRESFATAPERLLLAAREATSLRLGADTIIDGRPHARLMVSLPELSRLPVSIFLRRSDGVPTMTRFRAAQPNDGGLAPYGEMEVEVWWSGWQPVAVAGTKVVTYPMQWDINRVGRPFQRITMMLANFNVPSTPDSFAVNDSLRSAFFAGPTSRPMWQAVSVDSGVIEGQFASYFRGGRRAIAVLVGTHWVFLEGAQTVEARRREIAWLTRQVAGSRIGAAIVSTRNGSGVGTGFLLGQGVPVFVAPGAKRSVTEVGKNWGDQVHGTAVTAGRWVDMGGDSLWIEPVDLPFAPGVMLAYVPSLRWLYIPVQAPESVQLLLDLAKKRGWAVSSTGSPGPGVVKSPLPAPPPSAAGRP